MCIKEEQDFVYNITYSCSYIRAEAMTRNTVIGYNAGMSAGGRRAAAARAHAACRARNS